MDVATFRGLAEALTGTPVKDLTDRDEGFLAAVLADEQRTVDCSQLNELLLVNKDRMEPPFFDHFFRPGCRVAGLREGVERFQRMALLRYGNFIFAYRTLSRVRTADGLVKELGEYAAAPEDLARAYAGRSPKLLEVEQIAREVTPLVGYLSAGEIIAERDRAGLLRLSLPVAEGLAGAAWPAYEQEVLANADAREHRPLRTILANYRARHEGASVADFAAYLGGIVPQLEERSARLDEVRARAVRNQDVYLTWDHMDVYFATSMRKRWEFEDLYDFVNGLMTRPELADLTLRYFDPTQSYTSNRVNKGLVESLMLKRAKCTVYSVQDTDTLGKDSELAATLAQGKPVIAYVPEIDLPQRVAQLLAEDPVTIQERLRFVIYADEHFAANLSANDLEFVEEFRELGRFERGRIWRSVPGAAAVAAFRAEHRA